MKRVAVLVAKLVAAVAAFFVAVLAAGVAEVGWRRWRKR